MHKHHWSPGTRPGNWYSGLGVMRSLPFSRLNCKNGLVTIAQTRCLPRSLSSVLQQPSRKKPVRGSKEQGTRGSPRTFRATSLVMATFDIFTWRNAVDESPKCKKKRLNLLEVGLRARISGWIHNWGQADQALRPWGETEWLKQYGLNWRAGFWATTALAIKWAITRWSIFSKEVQTS